VNPPRSLLYVPATRPAALDKLATLPADACVIDLEDAVAPGAKDDARAAVRAALKDGRLAAGGAWSLRVNAAGSAWHEEDLALLSECRPARAVLPKAERAIDVVRLAALASAAGASVGLVLETAAGIGRAKELAGAHPAVDLLILGSADLQRSLRARPDPERRWEAHALAELLLAARMTGAAAIDSVYFHFRDEEGLKRHALAARDLGYDGKSCIHPAQVAPIHEVFRSTPAELAWARRVLAAFEDPAPGAIRVVDGEMLEALHLPIAQRILARA